MSAQLAELGLTFAQQTVESKSNEIPATQALLKELDIRGHLVTADAMNCQTNTAEIIVNEKMRQAVEHHIRDEKNRDKITQAESYDTGTDAMREEALTSFLSPF